MEFASSAFRHGITKNQIAQALAEPARSSYDMADSRRGNLRVMYVGHTHSEVLIEVGVEYAEDGPRIFHAKKASSHSKRQVRL